MGINELIKIGDRLKTLRLNKGLTQAQLADSVGIPRTTYANYETNKREPKLDVLNKISKYLDVTVDEILTKSFIHKDDNERLYLLSLKIDELVPFYSFEEIEKALEMTKERIEKGQLIISEEQLNKDEKIDILIGSFSASDYRNEIAQILAIKTSYNLSGDLYIKHFDGRVNEEIINFISDSIAVYNDPQDETIAWNCILDTLGFEYSLDIIKNNLYYRQNYISSTLLVDDIKDIVLKEFAKIPDMLENNTTDKKNY